MLIEIEQHDDETFFEISLSRREIDLLKLGDSVSKSRLINTARITFCINPPTPTFREIYGQENKQIEKES